MRRHRWRPRGSSSLGIAILAFAGCVLCGAGELDAAPQIGIAKSVLSGPTNNNDGTYQLTYRIRVENTGDEALNGVQVTDDLDATFAGATAFMPNFAVSPDFLLNPGYDGRNDTNVLAGIDGLGIGASGVIDVTVTVTPGAKLGPYDNVAVASALGALAATPVNDTSTDGSNPDANGNGDPTDDSTPTSTTFVENPVLGAAKQLLASPTNHGDGSYTLTYRVFVENFGDVPVNGVQIVENLSATFAGAQGFAVNAIVSSDLTINPFFDGAGQSNLLWGTDALPMGGSGSVDLTVTVTPGTQLGPYENTATATATSAGGQLLTDDSTDGTVADANGNGNPSDDAVPTSLVFAEAPEIGLAKSIWSGPTSNGDGTYTLTYRFHVSNSGDTRVDALQIFDDLSLTFGGAEAFVVDGVSSNDFSANGGYNGSSDANLLLTGNSLNAGTSGTLNLTVTVTPGAALGPHDNSATLSATSAGGATLADVSTSGDVADANGNGDPSDDSEATTLTFSETPRIGAAKRVLSATSNGDGTYAVRYRIVVQNMGDALLRDVMLEDDLATTFAGSQAFSVDAVTSSSLDVNGAFDGVTDIELLTGTNTLVASAGGQVDLTLTVTPGAKLGPYDNTSVVSATSAAGTGVSDVSARGSNPDPNGNGDPTDNDLPTPITFTEAPVLGAAKQIVAGPNNHGDGSYSLTYRMLVVNSGDVLLEGVQLTDDLSATFAGASSFTVDAVTSGDLTINAGYDGVTDTDLLAGADALPALASGTVDLAVTVVPANVLGPYENNALVSATTTGGVPVADTSTEGADPDADGNGDPGDDATPTNVTFVEAPRIGLAKQIVSGPQNNGDGSYTLTYRLFMTNSGDARLTQVQVRDDLGATFAGAQGFNVDAVTSTDFSVNSGFDGSVDLALLTGADALDAGAGGSVDLVVTVTPGLVLGPYNNSATADATSAGGSAVADTSTDGSDPDANGDGNPNNDASPTPVSFLESPEIGVAKEIVAAPTNLGDGTYDVTYRVWIENSGDVPVLSVQAQDVLAVTFANAANYSVLGASSANLAVNPSYDGDADANLLTGDDTLLPGQRASVDVSVRVTPGTDLGPYANTANAQASSPGGAAVNDMSTSGSEPDANGNGDPGDDGAPTLVSFDEAPQIGAAKEIVSGPTNNGDGTYALTYRIHVENTGDVRLDAVQVIDDLGATFAAATSHVALSATSADFTLNPGYDGSSDTNLLIGWDALDPGASGAIDVFVQVRPGTTLGPYDNVAQASGTSPAGTGVADASTQGSGVDANGNGNPNDDSTPTSVTFVEAPQVGAAKALVAGPTNLGDGTYTLTYRITVLNSGDVPLGAVQLSDSLQATFTGVTGIAVDALTSADLTTNPFFDGVTDPNLLGGTDVLAPGAGGSVEVTLTVTPGNSLGPHLNRAHASGASPGGFVVTDASTDGFDPDPTLNGDPGDDSTPTPVTFSEAPVLGIAKRVLSGPASQGDGTYTLTYRVRVENLGDAQIQTVQVTDDLTSTFASAVTFSVGGKSANGLSINPWFDGRNDTNLLLGSDGLVAGTSGYVDFTVSVTPGSDLGPYSNAAQAAATSAGGAPLADTSTDGGVPDANGNGDPGDDSVPTNVTFTETPRIGVAKSISLGPVNHGDGTYSLTYAIELHNSGDVPLNAVQISDDLGSAFASAVDFQVDGVSSATLGVDPAYDGISNTTLLDGNDALLAGASARVEIALTVTPGTNLGPYANRANAAATSTAGTNVADVSTAGTDPDPDGDGDPTNNTSDTMLTFTEAPELGIAKSVFASPVNNGDGSYTLTYRLTLENSGDALVRDVRVQDDLSVAFAAANGFTVDAVASSLPGVNPGYDGVSDVELLSGSDALNAVTSAWIDVTLTVTPGANLGPYDNQATLTGTSAAGAALADVSTSGTIPDADRDGDPGNDSTPTSVDFGESPRIGAAKEVVAGPTNHGDGTYTLTYRLRVENGGDVPLNAVQIVDDLNTTFRGVPVVVDALNATGLTVNPAYDGASDTNLLSGGDTLASGASANVDLTLTVTPGFDLAPFDNLASARGTSPAGSLVTDASTAGADPDANGNGDPGDDGTPTTVTLVESPSLGVTKRVTNAPVNNGDGTYTLTYALGVHNTGDGPVRNVQLSDDLSTTFAGSAFRIDALSSAQLEVNPAYDGSADTNLLTGSDSLTVGTSGSVSLTVTVTPETNLGPYANSAVGSATSAGNQTLGDASADGTDPDTNGNGDPSDDNTPTPVSFSESPRIGAAKALVEGPVGNGDGTYTLTFRMAVENHGDVLVRDLQVEDDLSSTFAGALGFAVETVTSSDLNVNAGFDGASDIDLLTGGDSLAVGARAELDVTVTVSPGTNLGPYQNQATARGTSPAGTAVADASAQGTDPDADGDGDPTNDATPTAIGFVENPQVGLAKTIQGPVVNHGDGTYTLTYRITIQNSGDVPLGSVQITDDLGVTFGAADAFRVDAATSGELSVNPAYDGSVDIDLLAGTDTLTPGAGGSVDVTVTVTPGADLGPYANSASGRGQSPSGSTPSDVSTAGSEPDANGNGDPADDATPTNVTFLESPQIGLAKAVTSGPNSNGDGTYTLTYRILVANTGDARLTGVQITDDLSAAFAGATHVQVDALASTNLTVNPSYDGALDVDLLSGSDALNAGAQASVDLTLTVTPGSNLGPYANSASARAQSAAGAAVADVSANGAAPDANGNGDPTDDNDATPVSFSESPAIGLAKELLQAPVNNGDGTYTLAYRLHMHNMGDVPVANVQITDDLSATFAAAVSFVVDAWSSSDFTVNPSFDGAGDAALLTGNDSLVNGQTGSVNLTVTVTPGATEGPYENQALGSAQSPAGTPLVDVSTTGALPDANGDGDASNDDTPTTVSFGEAPQIGLAKAVLAGPTNNEDGTYTLTYRLILENGGDVPVHDVQIHDDLAATFAAATDFRVDTVSSSELTTNVAYDGRADTNLLAAGQTLVPGAIATLDLGVTVTPGAVLGPYDNVATADATSAGGRALSDTSTDGSDPDADGNGDPGNDAVATTVGFGEAPQIGTAKAVVAGPTNNGDGTHTLTYRVTLENGGDVPLADVQVTDDLSTTFAGAASFVVNAVSSLDLTVNSSYDGSSNFDLLSGTDVLAPGARGTLDLQVTVTTGGVFGPFDNVAVARGTSPAGVTPSDASTDGFEPDADGDGDPGNDATPTRVFVGESPILGLAKRVSDGPHNNGDGTYTLTYTIFVENAGDVTLSALQVFEDLQSVFASAQAYRVDAVQSDEFKIDSAYNGNAFTGLLVGTDALAPGTSGSIRMTATVTPGADLGPYWNQARGTARTPGGNTVVDTSTDGAVPDADGDGHPGNDDAATGVSFTESPQLGVAKDVVGAPQDRGDGSYGVTYRFTLINSGDVVLNDLQLVDSLGVAFAGAQSVSVEDVRSPTLSTQASYDGVTSVDLLDPGNTLAAGASAEITLDLRVVPGDVQGPYANHAWLRGTTPALAVLSDLSAAGSVPDANANGDPTDDSDATVISFDTSSRIGLAMALAAGPVGQGDGSYRLTYALYVENVGDTTLRDVQVLDDLAAAFAAASGFAVESVRSDDFTPSATYDGAGDTALLAGTDVLQSRARGSVEIDVRVTPGAVLGPYSNSASVRGTNPDGAWVQDVSTDGTNVDPNGNGNAGDDAAPTEVTFVETPQIGLAKAVETQPTQNPDGTWSATYALVVTNTGDVRVHDVQITDDLAATFVGVRGFQVEALTSTTLRVNPAYDGRNDVNLLVGSDSLATGAAGTVHMAVRIDPGGASGPFLNSAVASAASPAQKAVSDVSTSGPSADPDGNGDPADNQEPTPLTLPSQPASLRVSKSADRREVMPGDLVRYTIEVENMLDVVEAGVGLDDRLPAGFTYVVGSARVLRDDATPQALEPTGRRALRFDGMTLGGRETVRLQYVVRVGSGVGLGEHTNRVVALQNGVAVGNTASASVQRVLDPALEQTTVLGKVFHDRDGDGWQDPADATDVRLRIDFGNARYVANSTTLDAGDGMRRFADVAGRSPFSDEVLLGDLPAATSAHVQATRFTVTAELRGAGLPEVLLTSAEGSVVRLRSDGTIETAHRGAKKRGTNGQDLVVSRRIERDGERRRLVLTIGNRGVDESGIAGVRLATASGLIVHTDHAGRYHVAGVDAGPGTLGRNFILKLDPQSLPRGATLSTENPRVLHLTPGLINRIDFGVVSEAAEVAEPTRVRAQSQLQLRKFLVPGVVDPVWDVEQAATFVLGAKSFQPGGAELTIDAKKRIAQLAGRFKTNPHATAVIQGHTDDSPVKTLLYADNYDLSIARARAVMYELILRHGISAHRLSALGFGADQPVEPGTSRDARWKNRRVEVKVYSGNVEKPSILDVQPHEVQFGLELGVRGDVPLRELTLHEFLPRGTEYVSGSAQLGDRALEPRVSFDGDLTRLRWQLDPSSVTSPRTLTYRARVSRAHPAYEMVGETQVRWHTADGDSGSSGPVRLHLFLSETTPKETTRFTLDSMSFPVGTAELTQHGEAALQIVRQKINQYARARVALEGHVETGAVVRDRSLRSPEDLARARARVVQRALLDGTHLRNDDVSVQAFGSTRPVDSNFTLLGRQRNRRVEIFVHGSMEPEPAWVADSTRARGVAIESIVDIDGFRSPGMRAAGGAASSRTSGDRRRGTRGGETTGPGSEDPVSRARRAGDDPRGIVQLPWGGTVWMVEDARRVEPRLQLHAPPQVHVDNGRVREPLTLRISSNYAAFVTRWELRLYRSDDPVQPVHTLTGSGLSAEHSVSWDGSVDAPASEGSVWRAGDEITAVLRVFDAAGHMDEAHPERMRLVDARWSGAAPTDDDARLRSDATEGAPRLQSIPLRGGLVRVHGSALPSDVRVQLDGDAVRVQPDGTFVAERFVPRGPQQMALAATRADGEEWAGSLDVEVEDSQLFVVGLADVGIGDTSHRGRRDLLAGDPLNDGSFYGTGRLAVYLKARWNSRYRATLHLDTREEEFENLGDRLDRKDPRRLFRHLDPDRHFLTYGDGSTTLSDVDTQGRFYARFDWDRSRVLWGNYATGLTGTEFGQYNRSLYGAQLQHRSLRSTTHGDARVDATAFVSEPQTAFAHNEFLGTGGSLYYLEHGEIVEGSEKIWVEVRDRDSDRVLENVTLARERDYEIDELQGRVLLRRPLMQTSGLVSPGIVRDTPLDGNRVVLLVDYEYVPQGFDPDEVTYGGRAKVWAGDVLGLGGTFVEESRDGQNYRLAGGDVAVRAGRGTYLKAEYAESEADQATSSAFSSDGGMTFTEVGLSQGSTAASALGVAGAARSLEGRLDVNELTGRTHLPTLGAWWKRRDAGFSTARLATARDTESFGAEVDWRATPRLSFGTRWSVVDASGARVDRRLSLQGTYRVRRWQLGAEVRDLSGSGAPGASTAGIGSAAAARPLTGPDREGTLGGVRVGLDVTPGVNVYAQGQATLRKENGVEDNHFGSLGVRARLGTRLELDAEAGAGTRGHAAKLGADVNVAPNQELFGTYTLSADRVDGDRGVLSLGQRRTLSDQLRVFSDHQFTHGERQSGRAQTFGLNLNPRPHLSLGGSLQRSHLDDASRGTIDRDAVSLTLGMRTPSSRLSLKGELRNDEGQTSRRQWLTSNRFDLGMSPDWTLLGKVSFARTLDRSAGSNDGAFLESGVGLAYRPVRHNRWNALARYTFLYDLPVESTSTRRDERSQVVSGDVGYSVHRRVELGGRYALKLQELREDRDAGTWAESRLDLAVLRARYHLLHKLDAVGEYRWLWNDHTQDMQHGALIAVYQHIAANLKLGAGFNATRFSDDLTQLDYDSYGWFLRLIGKY